MTTPIKYGKLVRDRMPEVIREDGWEPEVRTVIRPAELSSLLLAKLSEETAEVLAAHETGDILGELADVIEVAYAVGQSCGLTNADIDAARDDKNVARGGFRNGVFLVSIDKPKEPDPNRYRTDNSTFGRQNVDLLDSLK